MKKIFLFLAMVFYASSAAGAPVPQSVVFKGEGYAVKFSETVDFKKAATDGAIRNAVVTAIKSLTGESLYKNASDKLEGSVAVKSDQFVAGYKLLSEGWMVHYDMPDAAAIIGGARDSERVAKVETGPDELAGTLAPGAVEAYHVVVEANVDMKALSKEVRKYVVLVDEKSESVSIVILGIDDYREFEALREKLEKLDFIRSLSYSSFIKGKTVLKALVTESGSAFFEKLLKDLSGDYVVIPGGEGRVIVKAERKGK